MTEHQWDANQPARRFHCVHCDRNVSGKGLSLEESAHLIGKAHSLLDRLLTDLVFATEATYGIGTPPEYQGGRPSGHSDPTVRVGRGNPDLPHQSDRWADAAMFLALCTQWIKQATALLLNADEAAGLALQATDTHRGPADHVRAPYHEPIPPGRTDLAAAHDAKQKRAGRGEL